MSQQPTNPTNTVAFSPEGAAAILDALHIATRSVEDDIRRMRRNADEHEAAAFRSEQAGEPVVASDHRRSAKASLRRVEVAQRIVTRYGDAHDALREIAAGADPFAPLD